jgi:chaperone modulatory protein CbpM
MIMTEYTVTLTLSEICEQFALSESLCLEMVDYGIVRPAGQLPDDWSFDLDMVRLIQRALRLHSDLGLEWADIAIVNELIEERDRLRNENRLLRQQLSRFLEN